ncbi:hypothetical protein KAR91_16445 [Candidatus Pacearchaeota archaeon]|nr:hypothetical protein [Candidatus Pacearchaeota archaeon]
MENKKKRMIIAITIAIAMIFIVSSYSQTTGKIISSIPENHENKTSSITPKIKSSTIKERIEIEEIPKNDIAIKYENSINKITESYDEIKKEIENLEKIKRDIQTQNEQSENSKKELEEYKKELDQTKEELQIIKNIKQNPKYNIFYLISIALNMGGLGILVLNPKNKTLQKKPKKRTNQLKN